MLALLPVVIAAVFVIVLIIWALSRVSGSGRTRLDDSSWNDSSAFHSPAEPFSDMHHHHHHHPHHYNDPGHGFGTGDFGGSDFSGSDLGVTDSGGAESGGFDFGGADSSGSDFGGSDFGGSGFGGSDSCGGSD